MTQLKLSHPQISNQIIRQGKHNLGQDLLHQL